MDTTNIAIPKKEIAPGVFSTGGTATIPSNSPAANVISPESLKPVPTTNVPTFKPEIPSVEGDVAYYNQLLNQQTDNQKQLEIVRNQGLGEVSKLVQELTGQGNEQLALEQQFVNPAQQQLQGLTGQIGTQLAEYRGLATAYDKQSADIEAGAGRKGLTTGAVMGQQGAIERAKSARLNEKASEISLLQAEAQAVQGKVELAQKQVDRAIDLKYQSKQQEIEARKFQLASISDMLTREEKKQADAINLSLQKEEKRIAEAKDNEKAVAKMIVDAAPNAPTNVIAAAKSIAEKGGSSLEVAQALGKYGGDYLGDMLKKVSIADKQASIRKTDAEINEIKNAVKNTGVQLNFPAVAGTTKDLTQKMLNSASQKSDLSQGEREKLAKMALVVQQLDTLQSSIENSNKTGLIKGRVNDVLANLGADAEAGYINAQLTALVPNVARGIYGEVGVLTKDDVNLYKKTLPNIKTIAQQNDLVLAMTLKNAVLSYENALKSAVNSNINVSGWTEDYVAIKKQVSDVEDRAGVTKTKVDTFYLENPDLKPMIKELYEAGATDREILQTLGIE